MRAHQPPSKVPDPTHERIRRQRIKIDSATIDERGGPSAYDE
jgi:hypothetical protein